MNKLAGFGSDELVAELKRRWVVDTDASTKRLAALKAAGWSVALVDEDDDFEHVTLVAPGLVVPASEEVDEWIKTLPDEQVAMESFSFRSKF